MNDSDFLLALNHAISPDRVLIKPAQLTVYESDGLTAYHTRPLAVALPETQDEVVQIVRLCSNYQIPFVTRGSGTSLSGGSLPIAGGIVIAMNRLNHILRIDPLDRIAVVEAGVINSDVTRAASSYGLYYAPDPSSQPICTIGGNLAFNAGGAHCLKYGTTSNHILGIKTILPDGEIISLGSDSLESAGPDLTGLYVGSEGLFGVVLEVILRLLPIPARFRTILASYDSLEAAGEAVAKVVATGFLPGAMEIMDHLAIEASEAAVHAGYPLQAAALLIVELDGDSLQVEAEFPLLQQIIQESGAQESHIAKDETDRLRIWKGRKSAFSAIGRLSPDYLVNDGVVPRSRLGKALAEIGSLSRKFELRVANVFHAGDGNLHPLILFDGSKPGEFERAKHLSSEILDLCIRMGGSITGEHGIGMEKRAYFNRMFSEVDVETMHNIRLVLDPAEISNRGKMFSS